MKIIFFYLFLLLFDISVFGQRLPDTCYVTKYDSGEIYKNICIWKGDLTCTTVFKKNQIKTINSCVWVEKDTTYCDTTLYYDNGKVQKQIAYKNNLKHCLYMEYFDNGKLMTRGNYVNDIKQDDWYSFNKEYTNEKILQYKNGIIIKTTNLDLKE